MVLSLNCCCINLVIFRICADKPDIGNAVLVNNNNQTVAIALVVEHHPVVCQKTGALVGVFDIGWRFPIRSMGIMVPGLQWQAAIRMLFPEGA